MKKLLIQFNEANFDIIKKYCTANKLPTFQKLLDNYNCIETSSEKEYKNLEPWIQWYSFYSNLKYEDHRVFNLGDCLKNEHDNFLIKEAKKGKRVGVFSAMNCRPSRNFHTYLPDPWTESAVKGGLSEKIVFNTVKKLINENAKLKITLRDIFGIFFIIGIPKTFDDFFLLYKATSSLIKRDRAILASIFDYFFGKYCLRRSKNSDLDLSIFFLNGLAHVQHHYLLNSVHVSGNNPSWYSNSNDSLLESLQIYDKFFKYLDNNFSKSYELWIITGLSQEAYPDPFIYWRFENHKKLLNKFINQVFSVYPRMTRDFEIHINDHGNLQEIFLFLKGAIIQTKKGEILMKAFCNIDITSDRSIFASFAYSGVDTDVDLAFNGKTVSLSDEINFIALKNGGHIEDGWALTNKNNHVITCKIPIWELSEYILNFKK